jgi:hypothetical protein
MPYGSSRIGRDARRCLPLLVTLLLLTGEAAAQVTAYRWVDEHGGVHYAGRRDLVPEQYRSQLPAEGPGEPAKPRLPDPPKSVRVAEPGECVLRHRGTAAQVGTSRAYPSCEACWKALSKLPGDERTRAECIASSVKSYR